MAGESVRCSCGPVGLLIALFVALSVALVVALVVGVTYALGNPTEAAVR
ncbi:hypothetical protein [Streptomyces geranii]|nr:hypothetical protein [Streptomyces geranii]